jgi:hypothetical protein
MRFVIITIILFVISAVTIPFTWSKTEPMIREIAMSGPGEPDLTHPRMIGKVGLIVAVASFVLALGFSILSITNLSRGYRPIACFVASLLTAGVPCSIVMQGGPYNSAGDGGPNFWPLLVIAGGGVIALPFLLWSIVSLFFLKPPPQ